jgi:Na+-driven multidrug efflux pump
MGIKGAAAATAAATVAGFTVENFLLRRAERLELKALPGGVAEAPRTEGGVGRLAKEAAPIAMVLLSKSLVGVFLTAAGATGDVVKLAAHQIAGSLFWFLCPFGDALANAAQALLPGQLKSKSVTDGQVVATFLRQTLACAAFSGLLISAIIAGGVANAFTSSAACLQIVSSVALPVTLTLVSYCVATAVEGSMFALGAAGPVAVLMPLNAAAVCAAFYTLRRAAAPLPAVWLTFLAYQLVRLPQLALVARSALLKRSRAQEAQALVAAAAGASRIE